MASIKKPISPIFDKVPASKAATLDPLLKISPEHKIKAAPKLNENQLKAVNTLTGNLLIIASAGTGKTTTLVERYLNLVQNHGYLPESVLMTTFTNKAAKDLIRKISNRTDKLPEWIGTMHSLFLRIIRDNADRLFREPKFTLLTEESDKKKIIRVILKEIGIDPVSNNVRYFIAWISKFKSLGILAENLSIDSSLDDMRESGIIKELLDDEIVSVDASFRKKVNLVYKKYQEYMSKSNSVDFDDILLLTRKLFMEEKKILQKYKEQFKIIMVDEAQDLNLVQMQILELLSSENLCLIGDDCQNIFEWRGSSNELVFKFNETKNKVYLLENYRSTGEIISSVNKVIASLADKIDKKLIGTRHAGDAIKIEGFDDFYEEVNFVVSEIEELLAAKEKPENIAVLFRTNEIGKLLEREMRIRKIPCILAKSKDFFDREEIKDLLSFLKLKVNQTNELAFERILGLLSGVGKEKIKSLKKLAEDKSLSLVAALEEAQNTKLPANIKEQLQLISDLLTTFKKDPLKQFLEEFEYERRLIQKYEFEGSKLNDKLANLEVIKELFKEYNPSKESISNFLDSLIEIDKKEKGEGKVILSTVHSAKGLEFKRVFLIACNEQLLPFYTAKLSRAKRDSELRLFYVAISRAKDHLTISYSKKRDFRTSKKSQLLEIIEE